MGGPGSGRKRCGGRPTKLTPQLHLEIVKFIEAGNYIETAAAVAGVSPSTLRHWIRRGARQRDGPYRLFSEAVKRAEARAEASALVRIRQAGEKNWTAEAWYLERKFPHKWGRWERGASDVPQDDDRTRQILKNKGVRDLLDEVADRLGVEVDTSKPSGES